MAAPATDAVKIGKANAASMILSNLKNIEMLELSGDSYHITTTDGVVANGAQLFVAIDETGGHTLWFDGSAETNGSFGLVGGTGHDHLRGGSKSDGIGGGGGADFLRGRGGDDNYFYDTVSDSTSRHFDTIYGFNAASDRERLVLSDDSITGIDAKITHGSLSGASFDSDLATAANAARLLAHHAVLFTPDAGTFSGQRFMVVDANGQAGYQAGADYVIRLQSATHLGQLSTNSFATF